MGAGVGWKPVEIRALQRVADGAVASASPRILLETQTLRPTPDQLS